MAPNVGDYIDHAEERRDVYYAARDVDYMITTCPSWWWDRGNSDQYLRSTECTISVVEEDRTYKAAYRVATDSIRFFKDEYRGWSWRDIDEAKPVIFVAPPDNANRCFTPRGNSPCGTLLDIMDIFFEEMQPLVAPNWRPWATIFRGLNIEDKLRILESLPPLFRPSQDFPVQSHLLIIVGIDRADNPKTRAQVMQFLQVVEKMFVANRKGKVLLFTDSPWSGLSDMVKDPSCVVDLKKRYERSTESSDEA
ncbi:hypothetical protein F4677DRAFT_465629 [Hypoxylon crocopeplum]|nr:hypothetical protein F4677DRAFT_465629 [Hypoxylon crocopeplum]